MTAQQLPLDLKSLPVLGRDDFFVGACNELAVNWVEKWPTGWGHFPAFTLHGPRGSGKSHLAEVWRKGSGAIILDNDQFLKTPIDKLMDGNHHLVLDHLDKLIGDRVAEEHVFHLYNACHYHHLYFLGLAHKSPEEMPFVIKDLASRLRAAPHAAMLPPDDELLVKVLGRRFHDQGYVVGEPTLRYIVTRMERSWEALDHLITAAIAKATAEKKQITIPLMKDLLSGE